MFLQLSFRNMFIASPASDTQRESRDWGVNTDLGTFIAYLPYHALSNEMTGEW
jgi:hypothetical protein